MKTLPFLAIAALLCISAHAAEPSSQSAEEAQQDCIANADSFEAFQRCVPDASLVRDDVEEDEDMDASSAVEDASSAGALVNIRIHLKSHRIEMSSPEDEQFSDGAIGGRPGHRTPIGCFRPTILIKNAWSARYHAPMPNSVFFYGHLDAMHTGSLSTPSHGCIHLRPETSLKVYNTVAKYKNSTRICTSND